MEFLRYFLGKTHFSEIDIGRLEEIDWLEQFEFGDGAADVY
jgi:hypothetical protein